MLKNRLQVVVPLGILLGVLFAVAPLFLPAQSAVPAGHARPLQRGQQLGD